MTTVVLLFSCRSCGFESQILMRYLQLTCMAPTQTLSRLKLSRIRWHPWPVKRHFSGMSTSGLSTTQIVVRESIQKICSEFPDEYWSEKDRFGLRTCFHNVLSDFLVCRKSEYAGGLHLELARTGFLGICMYVLPSVCTSFSPL